MSNVLRLTLFVYFSTASFASVYGAEGYSSSEISIPANIYYRAFTINTRQEACEESPAVATIKLRLPNTTMAVGERLVTNLSDGSVVSDLFIAAYDVEGKFVPSVPVLVDVYSIGRTRHYNP
ncbi:MAG: hypothetical protein ACI95C_001107 [Pseudohongiellaceae bacterium]|jgi:hypothetical protein